MSTDEQPTEHDILYQTLVVPSSLNAVISLDEFTALFPANLRDHGQIPALFRALQYQRALDTDHVRENIELEVKRGQRQRRELHKARVKGPEAQELDVDDQGQNKFLASGPDGLPEDPALQAQTGAQQWHSLSTIIPAMETAVSSLEAEIADKELEVEQTQASLEASIGDLSDLRYGRLSRSHLRKELLESLKSLAAKSEEASRNLQNS